MAVNAGVGRLRSSYPSLRHPLYRRLLLAALLFEMGLVIFEVALFWVAARSIGATAFVGTLFALIVLPASGLAIPAGLISDRIGPRALVLAGAALAVVISLTAAWLSMGGHLGAWPAAALALALGLSLGTWAVPAQVIVGLAVPAEIVPNAVALSVLPSGIAAMLGGSVAGTVLRWHDAPATFLLGAVVLSGAAVLGLRLRLADARTTAGATAATARAAAGATAAAARAAAETVAETMATTMPVPAPRVRPAPLAVTLRRMRGDRVLAGLILLAVTASLFLMGRLAMLPALVNETLRGGPDELGLLVAAGGVGTLAGSLLADACGRVLGRGPSLLCGLITAGACLAALGLSRVALLSMVLAGLTAAAAIVWQVTSAAMIQQSAPPGDRGRVLGVYDLFRVGTIPIGSVGLGLLADRVGVAATCVLAGAATIVVAALTAVANAPLRRLRAMPVPRNPSAPTP